MSGPQLDPGRLLERLLTGPGRRGRLVHVEHLPARGGRESQWPGWVPAQLVSSYAALGVTRPWEHQVAAAEHAHGGRSVVVATGTASGKSMAYQLPALTAVIEGARTYDGRGATALYLSPTKALAADQLRALHNLDLPDVRAATYDGDTPYEERDWARSHAAYVLTNPDMLHRSMLPGHARWAQFLRVLKYVVIDEMHTYRGVFGSHVAAVLRRLRRVCTRYGADPTFVLASATVSAPEESARRLTGVEIVEVVDDASPRGAVAFALWEPPLTDLVGERGAPVRRSANAEVGDLLTDLVVEDVRTLAFVRSRRGAELVASMARDALDEVEPGLGRTVAAYRSGYLPEERRALEADLQDGTLRGVAATTALELGLDVAGLDAVLLAGWPGTRASMWQQAGRAGRAHEGALAVLVARDDPLDTYLVHHPEAVFGLPVEASVLDPDNPYVLGPHLCAAAAELPLTVADLTLFGPQTAGLLDELTRRGLLRQRVAGWFWTRAERATDLADLRGTGGGPIRLVEGSTGRLLGTADASSADRMVHPGAVYVHQGATFLVDALDLDERLAFMTPARPDYTTTAREITDVRVLETISSGWLGAAALSFGEVEVTGQVVSFLRKRLMSSEVMGEEPLDLPARSLRTKAVWWTLSLDQVIAGGIDPADLPGAAHAAEHASIGLLPLVATCDRWDIGGLSTALHEDTGRPTVFVYDGYPGGAGFAERGFNDAQTWITATRAAIAACECDAGCPSCVQSPKCGNGNDPLDKAGALRLLALLLAPASSPAD